MAATIAGLGVHPVTGDQSSTSTPFATPNR